MSYLYYLNFSREFYRQTTSQHCSQHQKIKKRNRKQKQLVKIRKIINKTTKLGSSKGEIKACTKYDPHTLFFFNNLLVAVVRWHFRWLQK